MYIIILLLQEIANVYRNQWGGNLDGVSWDRPTPGETTVKGGGSEEQKRIVFLSTEGLDEK